MKFALKVNGTVYDCNVSSDTTLLTVLRDDFNLTGTKFGCGHGVCGACSILLDGQSKAACKLMAGEVVGKEITTVEGLAKSGKLHAVQKAFLDEDAMQCGFCTSGMLISAAGLLLNNPHPNEGEIREALAHHFCRCGIYLRVIRAIKRAIP